MKEKHITRIFGIQQIQKAHLNLGKQAKEHDNSYVMPKAQRKQWVKFLPDFK